MPLSVGIDIGSKTIKAAVLREDKCAGYGLDPIFSAYRSHNGRPRATLASLFEELGERFGVEPMTLSLTGSGATGLAQASGMPFTQEVVAAHRSVKTLYPDADAFIELGGEDAKLVYLSEPVEHRMNTSCAGGTGSFIEDVASMLGVSLTELDELAAVGKPCFAIAARCAVFAQRDLKPLLAAGSNRADIVASAYQAVVNQTLGTLACGRMPHGKVLFLGGPMEHLPALVECFRASLDLDDKHGIKPPNAQLMSALGAALNARGKDEGSSIAQIAERLLQGEAEAVGSLPLLEPLASIEDNAESIEGMLEKVDLEDASLPLYLGFDAGSTTVKMAAIDAAGRLVASSYDLDPGNPSRASKNMLKAFRARLVEAGIDPDAGIDSIMACGYGERMLTDAINATDTIAETAAHLRGALAVFPQASFVLDIGGQDMKALWVKDGALVSTAVNETCSSGCGAFMSSAAKTLQMELEELDCAALEAKAPVDLGARCTVFMRSRVRHAQEMGAAPEDIAAGAAYSVANNALRRLIGPKRAGTLGDFIVVQGGAFASDAVRLAFERELGQRTHRSPLGPLMGAIGAAFSALDAAKGQTTRKDGQQRRGKSAAPNVAAYQQELLDAYRGSTGTGRRARIHVGLIASMNDYEALPFWHTLLARLGFSVVVPHDCAEAISQTEVSSTLVSDMVCLPAQQSHLHALQLAKAGATVIFCPSSAESGMCPVTREYQQVLPYALEQAIRIPIHVPQLGRFSPRAMNKVLADPEELRECLEELLEDSDRLGHDELASAVDAAYAEYHAFVERIEKAADEALAWVHTDPNRHGIVLSGRSYHTSPELLNGIDVILSEQGFAVLPPLGVNKQASRARRPFIDHTIDRRRTWVAAKHMLGFAALAVVDPQLDVVCLQSFGCGIDAVSILDVQHLLEEHGKPFTLIKLDSKADPAHTKIRIRALADSIASRRNTELAAAQKLGAQCAQTRGSNPSNDEALENAVLGIKLAPPADVFQASWSFKGVTDDDVARAQRSIPSDICGTAALLAAHAINESKAHPQTRIQLPAPCEGCITQAAQHLVTLSGSDNLVEWVSDWPSDDFVAHQPAAMRGAPRMGLCGNPLMLFDPKANQDIAAYIRSQGAEPVYPQLDSWYSDCGHYMPQLESLYTQGIRHVLLLQSFLCLKTHVHVRGAMKELREAFPDMSFTVIDIDPQASSLNVRNRVLLALEELKHNVEHKPH